MSQNSSNTIQDISPQFELFQDEKSHYPVKKPNELARGKWVLELRGYRMINAVLGVGEQSLTNKRLFTVHASDYHEIFFPGTSKSWAYRDLAKAVKELREAYFSRYNEDEMSFTEINLIEAVEYHGKKGTATILFTESGFKAISDTTQDYTKTYLMNSSNLKSAISWSLNDLFASYRYLGEVFRTVPDLLEHLNLSPDYQVGNLNKRIERSVQEVNSQGYMKVSFEVIYKGKRVHGYLFKIGYARKFLDNYSVPEAHGLLNLFQKQGISNEDFARLVDVLSAGGKNKKKILQTVVDQNLTNLLHGHTLYGVPIKDCINKVIAGGWSVIEPRFFDPNKTPPSGISKARKTGEALESQNQSAIEKFAGKE